MEQAALTAAEDELLVHRRYLQGLALQLFNRLVARGKLPVDIAAVQAGRAVTGTPESAT